MSARRVTPERLEDVAGHLYRAEMRVRDLRFKVSELVCEEREPGEGGGAVSCWTDWDGIEEREMCPACTERQPYYVDLKAALAKRRAARRAWLAVMHRYAGQVEDAAVGARGAAQDPTPGEGA